MAKLNLLVKIAKRRKRDYITSEDVAFAIDSRRHEIADIRLAVLEVLGKQTGFGAEDPGLCAFVAWEGKRSDEE